MELALCIGCTYFKLKNQILIHINVMFLVNQYPHLFLFLLLALLFAVTQSYYAYKLRFNMKEKYHRQYKILNRVTAIVFLAMAFIIGIYMLAK